MGAFAPSGPNLAHTAGAASSGAVLPGDGGDEVRVVHLVSASTAYLAFGFGAVPTATNADIPIAGNSEATFSLPAGCTHIALVVGSGTPIIYVQRGGGHS